MLEDMFTLRLLKEKVTEKEIGAVEIIKGPFKGLIYSYDKIEYIENQLNFEIIEYTPVEFEKTAVNVSEYNRLVGDILVHMLRTELEREQQKPE